MRAFIITVFVALTVPTALVAQGILTEEKTEEKIASITEAIQESLPSWTLSKTRSLLEQSKFSGVVVESHFTDQGVTSIEVHGETILLNGKDITGNLGNKTTHGDNSPILGDIRGSQVATGPNSHASSNSYIISLAFNLALTLSLVLCLYFIRRQRIAITNLQSQHTVHDQVRLVTDSTKRAANN